MAILQRAKSSIAGLTTDLSNLADNISDEAAARATADGDLGTLVTTAKGNLVAAVNEVSGAASAAASAASDAADAAAGALVKTANLSDVADAATALSNLGGINQAALEAAIDAAKLAGGVSIDVADITARDALEGLTTADRVWVADDGDSKWAIYKPTAVDEDGKGTAWLKLYDEDALTNSLTAAGIKAAYESNDDTNAFTDAEKAKLAYITVAAAIDLADVALKADVVATADLVQTLTGAGEADEVPSTAAVIAYVDANAGSGGVQAKLESLVVTDGTITLTETPAGGVQGILNFATVRYIDGSNIAYDAPVVATGDPKVFDVSTDSAGQWNGNTVQVQYVY